MSEAKEQRAVAAFQKLIDIQKQRIVYDDFPSAQELADRFGDLLGDVDPAMVSEGSFMVDPAGAVAAAIDPFFVRDMAELLETGACQRVLDL